MRIPPTPALACFEGGCAFVDGAYVPLSEAKLSLFDWGFTRSDATYDVASTWQGAFFRLDAHIDRFFRSLEIMRLSIPYSREELRQVLHGCVRAAGLKDAYVSMICTRGVPPKGARDPRLAQNRFYAYAVPYVWIASPEKQQQGIDLHISHRQRIPAASVDPTVKNYHWIDLVQSLFEAYDQGRDTSCVVDAQGNISEGPGFNLFMVKDGTVFTPDQGVLHGVSRRTVIELCQQLNIPVTVTPVPESDFRQADEIFLSSTGGGVLPIARVDGQAVPQFPGPVTQRIQQGYWDLHSVPAYNDTVDYR